MKPVRKQVESLQFALLSPDQIKKLSRAVEQSPASVIITNPEGDIEYVNEQFCKDSGYSNEEVIGKNPRIFKSGYHDKIFYEELWDTILTGKEWKGEMQNKKKNGNVFWESVAISSLINNEGDITHFVAIKQDITEKMRTRKELIEAKILSEKKIGNSNVIFLNLKNPNTINILSFVEQSSDLKKDDLKDITKEIVLIDSFASIGLFGSRVSGKATKSSDWDVFVITTKKRDIENIMSKFPHLSNIEVQFFDEDEFWQSLVSIEENVIKHIIKNKKIIYNPYPFYNLIQKWEMTKNAPV